MKQSTCTAKEFLLHKCRRNRKLKKCKYFFTSPACEFLLHKCRNNSKMDKCKINYSFLLHACRQTENRTDRRTYIYPPQEKRYNLIISTIHGPNELYSGENYEKKFTIKICKHELLGGT